MLSKKQYITEIWEGIRTGISEQYAKKRLSEYKEDLQKLKNHNIRPSRVVGTGYKNARKVAFEWLNEQIEKYKEAIQTKGHSIELNHRNYEHYKCTQKA